MEHSLHEGEPHPIAFSAMAWWIKVQVEDFNSIALIKESIYSSALAGNRAAEIMSSTLDRLAKGENVSDRYLLGLCWFIKNSLEEK